MSARPQLRPLTVITHGKPGPDAYRAIALLLLHLDKRPAVRVVHPKPLVPVTTT